MADKVSRADIVELLRVPVVAIVNAVQRTVSLLLDQVIVRFRKQAVAAVFRKRPGQRVAHLELQRNAQVRLKIAMDVELGAVGDRVVDLVGSDFTEQGRDFGICVLGPDRVPDSEV